MATWPQVQDSNEYRVLNQQGRTEVQQKYFDNVIFKSNEFQQLRPAQRLEVKNRFFSQDVIGQQRQQQRRNQLDEFMFRKMKGRLPSALPDPQLGFGILHKEEIERRQAYDYLQQRYSPEQIKFLAGVHKKLERPPTGRAIGGIVGAIGLPLAVGALIPGPFDEAITIPMAMAKAARTATPYIGAGLGGGIGEAIQVGLEEKRLLSRGEFLKAFATETAFEFGGRAFVRAGKFAFSPFIKRTIPEAATLVDDFAKVGGVLPPTALDRRFTLSVAEEISRGAFGARQVFEEMGQKTGRAARIYADQLLDLMADGTMRLGTEQLGSEFAEGITRPRGRIFRMLDDLFTPLYKEFDELAKSGQFGIRQIKGPPKPLLRGISGRFIPSKELIRIRRPPSFSTKSLKIFANKELKIDKRLKGLVLSPQGRSKLQKIMGLPENISAGDIRTLRSSFLGDVRKLARDVNKDEALIKRVASLTDDILFDPTAQRGLSNEANQLLRNINSLYRTSREALETTFSQRLAERITRNPASVVKELFPNNPTAIKNLRIALVEPISGRPSAEGKVLWKQLRTAWFDDAVQKATKEEVVKPHIFENALRPYIRTGALKEMIPDKEGMQQLQTIRDLLTAMSKKPAAGASLFIRGGQVGGLYMMYQGARDGDWLQVTAGGALVSGPYFFAKMAAHPLGSKLMRTGIKLKPGSTSLVPITARLVNLARKLEREELRAGRREIEIQRLREPVAAGGLFGPVP